jgi:hypothetical protein
MMSANQQTDRPRNRRSYRTALWVLGIITLNVSYFGYSYARWTGTMDHLEYGERLPSVKLMDLDGHRVASDGRWLLAIHFNCTAEPLRALKYAELLHRRYESRGLTVVGIASEPETPTRACVQQVHTSFPVVLDAGTVGSQLKLEKHPFFAFLADRDGIVRFSSDTAAPKDLRMITEKYLEGTINYRPAGSDEPLKTGDKLSFQAELLERANLAGKSATPALATLPIPSPGHLVVFNARCTVCSLEAGLSTFKLWEENVKREHEPVSLVFSMKFTQNEVLNHIEKYGIHTRAYLARGVMPNLEDPYSLESLFQTDILVLTIGVDGVISRIEDWNDFVAHSQSDKRKTV